MKKLLLLLSSLLLVACANTKQTATEILNKNQDTMKNVNSLKIAQELSFYLGEDDSKKIGTKVTGSIIQKPNTLAEMDSTTLFNGTEVTSKQYYDGEYLYTTINNEVLKTPASAKEFEAKTNLLTAPMLNMLKNANVTTTENEFIITADKNNTNSEAITDNFKQAMRIFSPDIANSEKITFEVTDFNFTLTIDKKSFHSKTSDMLMRIKISDGKESQVITTKISYNIDAINTIDSITIPEDIKAKAK